MVEPQLYLMRQPISERRRTGRPRDPQAGGAILGAALDVLARAGPTGFTIDAVAAAAGCGRATIYRRWKSRGALLVAAASTVCLPVVEPDLGSVQDDLVAWLGAHL